MTTIEKNKLITDFMGTYRNYDGNYSGTFSMIEHGGNVSYTKNNGRDHVTDGAVIRVSYSLEELLYNKSWDWLIPVINKITDLDEYTQYKNDNSMMFSDGSIYINTKFIESTYDQVIEFLEWYNKNK